MVVRSHPVGCGPNLDTRLCRYSGPVDFGALSTCESMVVGPLR